MKYRNDDPCDRVPSALGPQNRVVEHMKALPLREVGAAIRTARRRTKYPVARWRSSFWCGRRRGQS